MNNPKLICQNCHKEVELIIRDNRYSCPLCGYEFTSFETKGEFEKKFEGSSFLRFCKIVLLSLIAIFLVLLTLFLILLAFIFALCSQGTHGI